MNSLKEKIKEQIEDILSYKNERELGALSDMLGAWLEQEKGWGNTSDDEKEKIRLAFDSMEDPANCVRHDEMKLHLSKWREGLNGQKQ